MDCERKLLDELSNQCAFHWEINYFNFIFKSVGEYLLSPIFCPTPNSSDEHKNKWQLKLYPRSVDEKFKDYTSLYLINVSDCNITASFSLCLVDHNHQIIKTQTKKERNFLPNKARGFSDFVDRSLLTNSLKNFVVLCRINLKDTSVKNNETENLLDENSYRIQKFDRFEKILSDEDFSDVTIQANEKNYRLHKCILASCSEVFNDMLNNDLKNKNVSLLEIKDIKSEVLDEFFRFIYTEKINNVMTVVDQLLAVSEKYKVKVLKELCEDKMCSNLSKDNAVQYLKLAITHNAEQLKTHTVRWMSVNVKDLIKKPDFNEFGVQYPEFLLEIMKDCFTV